MNFLVLIKGGGDLASGVAHRLFVSGFRVVILELLEPKMIRRTVSFAEAVYSGKWRIEGVTARKVKKIPQKFLDGKRLNYIPVMVDPEGETVRIIKPDVLVDGRMAKRNLGTRRNDAPIVIGLGPGFVAGKDVDAVVETKRGHTLGKVIWKGEALPNTGVPGEIGGFSIERLLRSPSEGIFCPEKKIGDPVKKGDVVARVSGEAIRARIDGIVRGLLKEGLFVEKNFKVGDIDPREGIDVFTISDKARSIGGGVLEAILSCRKKMKGDGDTQNLHKESNQKIQIKEGE